MVTSALQLAIGHDDDGITFDTYNPNRLGNSFPQVDPCLQELNVHLVGNRTEVFQDSM